MSNIKQYKKGVKTKITKNFSSNEFDCKCKNSNCQWTYIDVDHVKKLQKKRNKWKKPVKITSGYRCEDYNRLVGGATKSRHKVGDATDFEVEGLSPKEAANDCEDFDGLGRYDTFTHADSRGYKARWDFTKKK